MLLRVLDRFRYAPISTEWTIPFGETFFHVGVHNLPPAFAGQILKEMSGFTAHPEECKLGQILEMLSSCRETLVVLNHPLWDETNIGLIQHAQTLGRLLERHRRFFHALELNGLRRWKENQQVIGLGRQVGLPLVGGGDRHGLEPNSILNLSRAETFAEFVREIRSKRSSHIVVMPQYRAPMALRISQMVTDILRDYPEQAGRKTWSDRVFVRGEKPENAIPISAVWKDGGPRALRAVIAATQILDWRSIRWAVRLALRRQAPAWSDQELAA